MEKEETKETSIISVREILKIIANMLFVLMLSVNVSLIYSFVSYDGIIITPTQTIIFSVFLSMLVTGLVLPFTKKVSKATLIINIILVIYLTLSQIKRIYTSDPIILSDLKFLGKLPQLASLAFGNISFSIMKKPIIMFIATTIYTIISYLVLRKFEFEIKSKKVRTTMFIVVLIVLIIMMNPIRGLRDAIFKIAYLTDQYADYDSYTSIGTYFLLYGILPGLYGMHINNVFYEPKNYNEIELNTLMSQVETIDEKSYGKPNIIMYYSESFYDLEKTGEVKYTTELCENFNKLKSENKAISVLTPTYGGMSENVAFETITGGSNNFFPIGYIPIMSLYDSESSRKMPSIARNLSENGYNTKIVFGEDDYASEDSYLRVGFDEYIEFRQYGIKHEEMTDALMFDYIKNDLLNKDKDDKNFYLVESFECHMPYSIDKYETYDIDIVSSRFDNSQEDIETIKSYSQAVHNADKELKNLYDFIQTYDEPTIVIFVGDHLPFLYNSIGENVLVKFDYFHTDDNIENIFRQYNTEALVFSNYDIDLSKIPDEMGSSLLLDSVVVNTDNKLDPYFYWLYDSRKVLPAMNRYLYIDAKGNKDFIDNISGKEKENYDLREKMQYMLFIKNKK